MGRNVVLLMLFGLSHLLLSHYAQTCALVNDYI